MPSGVEVPRSQLRRRVRGAAIFPGVREIRRTYATVTAETAGWEAEATASIAWRAASFTPEHVAAQRAAIMERGRQQ